MSADKKSAVNGSGKLILKVANRSGSIMMFKVWNGKPLRRLMRAYCRSAGLNIETVSFRFDGQLIKETDTPAGLDMEDEDTIDVFQ